MARMPANLLLHIPIVVSANERGMELSAYVKGLQVMSTRFFLWFRVQCT